MFAADGRRMIAVVPAAGEQDADAVIGHLAAALASQGKKVLVLDELLAAGETQAAFAVTARHDLCTVMLQQAGIETALIRVAKGIDFLAGGNLARGMPRPRMEARIGLINAFYKLAGQYDVVLVQACIDAAAGCPSFAWACQDVIVLSDDMAESVTEVYARLKLLHQQDQRGFHLLFRSAAQDRVALLYRNIAAVSRRHLRMMPEYLGALPQEIAAQAAFYDRLAGMVQSWPMPEHKAGHFPELMRRLLRGVPAQANTK